VLEARPVNRPMACSRAALPRAQAATWAWARIWARRAPPLGLYLAREPADADGRRMWSDGCPASALGQNRRARPPLKTLIPFPLLPSLSLSRAASAAERRRRRRTWRPGRSGRWCRRGFLAGARARRKVSALPSSEPWVAPFLREGRGRTPPASRRRRAATRLCARPARVRPCTAGEGYEGNAGRSREPQTLGLGFTVCFSFSIWRSGGGWAHLRRADWATVPLPPSPGAPCPAALLGSNGDGGGKSRRPFSVYGEGFSTSIRFESALSSFFRLEIGMMLSFEFSPTLCRSEIDVLPFVSFDSRTNLLSHTRSTL